MSAGPSTTAPWLRSSHACRLLGCLIQVKEQEVEPVLVSFAALFSILASYFLLLPLREDAGISLGTSTLPQLFAASLVATLCVTPAVSAFLNSRSRAQSRDAALRHLYYGMAAVLLCFYLLYNFTTVQALVDRAHALHQQPHQQQPPPPAAHTGVPSLQQQAQHAPGGKLTRHLLQQHSAMVAELTHGSAGSVAAVTSSSDSTAGGTSSSATTVTNSSSSSSAKSSTSSSSSWNGRTGDASLTKQQRLLRASFYIFANVSNLICISSLWAKCADAFDPDAGGRVFGFISAGATLGQLSGSLVAMRTSQVAGALALKTHGSRAAVAAAAAAAPASSLFLIAALLQLLTAHLVGRIRPIAGAAAAVRGSSFTGGSSGGALATGNRHGGSGVFVVADGCLPLQQLPNGSSGSSDSHLRRRSLDGPPLAASLATTGSVRPDAEQLLLSKARGPEDTPRSRSSRSSTSRGALALPGQLDRLLEGFQLILRSPYLLLLCSNLLLTYLVGSLMYFQRALVVSAAAAAHGPAFRTAFFSALNTYSAAGILIVQLFATSSLLRYLGMQLALGLAPAICITALIAIVASPTTTVVAVFEVVRKVYGYALLRPAREVLFTVVSRQEKYTAKLVIDTVVQRAGDALAAGLFEVLDVKYRLGQAAIGAAGCCLCVVWLGMALLLGRRHAQLAHHAGQHQPAAAGAHRL